MVAHPELYSAQAKAALKERILAQGADFRTTDQEREEFKQAFLARVRDEDLIWHEDLKGGDVATPQKAYELRAARVEMIKRAHPEVAHIPAEDLVALQAWTDLHHYGVVQDALEGDEVPPNPLGLSYAKAIISALNALPACFACKGTAYTGEDQSPQWVHERHVEGTIATNWRFFATSRTRDGAWQNKTVEWETLSASGKSIALFSHLPLEDEVLFPPGTRFLTTNIDATGTVATRKRGKPLLKIQQAQIVPPPPGPQPDKAWRQA